MVNEKCCVWYKLEFFSPELIDCVSLSDLILFSYESCRREKMMQKEVKKNLDFAEMEKKVGFDGHGLSV